MKKLIKYKIDFNAGLEFSKETLSSGYTFSKLFLQKFDFYQGEFYTLLPPNSNLEILQKPSQGRVLSYDENNVSLMQDVSRLLNKCLEKNNKLNCFFDDMFSDAHEKSWEGDIEDVNVMLHKKEVYYYINFNSSTENLLKTCFELSYTSWHSLAVINTFDFSKVQNNLLTIEMMEEVVSLTQFVILGAYDGEAYVFWKSNKTLVDIG